ncbi:MAG TPA: DUF4954 family protein [Niabella sp.]|nr:DUF4954 family protein [Chitinophagaceae bacterium]HRO84744.1 DUF4954 family protein [Niabella sp.]
MNIIKKHPIKNMGYNFIPKEYLPEGKDEYYLRFQQNPATDYRPLSAAEITVLKSNGNRCNNWEDVLVRDGIDIHLIERCTFYGLVRIGKLEPLFLEFSEFRTAVGLYNCLIVSCDIGNNVVLKNVRFLSYYIIEDDVIIANVNEMSCTSHTKFGNGIIKEGETEDVRIWLELCNENGGRKVMPFDGMLPADAWMWSKYRGDKELMEAFKRFTGQLFDSKRGYYGTVGRRTVIKNTQIIKDVKIGSDAYIKGANKLKNLTINSSADAKSQIGEGCEMVNGIMGYGSRSFYGVKAVRFILGSFSQLKYGARLINSYLGDNSTISCCEVLNSLIFPAHEQHHNNSFLCASLVMGQSNIAAGATIGSNHNSRGPDGELQAGRGFWPGLCVSLKHNSKFASYTMLAKGDYPAELNILLPFSLVSNDVHNDKLVIMPAYWMLHNMYAIARNEQKFRARDNRIQKTQLLEYDFLAPDTINEIFSALHLLKLFTGKAFYQKNKMHGSDEDFVQKGESLLENESPSVAQLDIVADGFENSQRPVQIVKVQQAYHIYKKLIVFYGTSQIIRLIDNQHITSFEALMTQLSAAIKRKSWMNIGGQLIPEEDFNDLIKDIKEVKIIGWHDVHNFYARESAAYLINKANHAIASLFDIYKIDKKDFTPEFLIHLFSEFLATKEWMVKNIVESKAKDYKNPFRKMVYDSAEEMENVVGRLEDNPFINEQTKELSEIKQKVAALITAFS